MHLPFILVFFFCWGDEIIGRRCGDEVSVHGIRVFV